MIKQLKFYSIFQYCPIFWLDKTNLHQGLWKLREDGKNGYNILKGAKIKMLTVWTPQIRFIGSFHACLQVKAGCQVPFFLFFAKSSYFLLLLFSRETIFYWGFKFMIQ